MTFLGLKMIIFGHFSKFIQNSIFQLAGKFWDSLGVQIWSKNATFLELKHESEATTAVILVLQQK